MSTGLAVSLGFVVVAITSGQVFHDRHPGPWEIVIDAVLGLCGGVFLLFAVTAAVRLVRRRPMLILDDVGITDHSTLAGVGLVQWHELRSVKETTYGPGGPLLSVEARHPDAIINRQRSALKRAALRFNQRRGLGVVLVAESALEGDIETILAAIRAGIEQSRPHQRHRHRH